MAEYIERETAISLLKNRYQDMSAMPASYYAGFQYALRMMEKIKPVVAVPVVRCRECKYWNEDAEWCREFSFFITPDGEPCSPAESMNWRSFQADDFCSYGVRKETEGEA